MMNLSDEFVAAVLQDDKLLKKAIRAGIRAEHLDNGYAKEVYKVAVDLAARGLEVTRDTVYNEFVKGDLAAKDKSVYANFSKRLFEKSVDAAQYSFEALRERRNVLDFAFAMQQAQQEFMKTKNVERAQRIIKSFTGSADQLVFRDYFSDEFIDWRVSERTKLASPDAGSIQMKGRFEFLAKYFPLGLTKQTVTNIGGPTGVGKTLLMTNLVELAVSPHNKLNVLYLIGENREIESTSRLDSVFTDMDYTHLYSGSSESTFLEHLEEIRQECGKLVTCKFHINSITVDDVSSAIEAYTDRTGVVFDAVFCDSPEHIRSSRYKEREYMRKVATYEDFKESAERLNYTFVSTLQLKASAAGRDNATSEDAAGAYAISQLADNQIFYLKNKEDFLLNRRRIVFPKLRDAKNDGAMVTLRVDNSLRMFEATNDQEFKTPSIGEDPDEVVEEQWQGHVAKMKMQPASFFYSLGSEQE